MLETMPSRRLLLIALMATAALCVPASATARPAVSLRLGLDLVATPHLGRDVAADLMTGRMRVRATYLLSAPASKRGPAGFRRLSGRLTSASATSSFLGRQCTFDGASAGQVSARCRGGSGFTQEDVDAELHALLVGQPRVSATVRLAPGRWAVEPVTEKTGNDLAFDIAHSLDRTSGACANAPAVSVPLGESVFALGSSQTTTFPCPPVPGAPAPPIPSTPRTRPHRVIASLARFYDDVAVGRAPSCSSVDAGDPFADIACGSTRRGRAVGRRSEPVDTPCLQPRAPGIIDGPYDSHYQCAFGGADRNAPGWSGSVAVSWRLRVH
jgi:hypothetical protein